MREEGEKEEKGKERENIHPLLCCPRSARQGKGRKRKGEEGF